MRLEEVALRAEAFQLVGDEVGARRAIAEHDLLLDEYRALAQRAIRSAVVEREMETVIAAAEGLEAPVHAHASASDTGAHPAGSRRLLSGVASVVALVAAAATLVVSQGEPDVPISGPLVNATADISAAPSAAPGTTPSPGAASEGAVAGTTPRPSTSQPPVGTPGASAPAGPAVVAGESASRTLAEQMIDTVAGIVADLEQAATEGLEVVTDELPDVDPDVIGDFIPDDAESPGDEPADEPGQDGSPSLSADDDSSADVDGDGTSPDASPDASADEETAAEDGAFVQEPAAE